SFNPQLASTAHDPLMVRALVISNGSTTAAIAVVDSCMVAREELDIAKEAVAKATAIPTNCQLISATHTHSAPFSNASNGTPEENAYQKQLIEGIGQAIIEAHGRLQPAKIGWGGYDVPDEVFNRRWFLKPGTMPANPFGETNELAKMNPGALSKDLIYPAGPTDPEVSILSIRDAKSGKPITLLANYSLHYVGSIPGNQMSADYFGEFSRLMSNRFFGGNVPDSFVALLSNGTSGDINNISFSKARPPREPFEQIQIVAAKVADASWHADRAATFSDDLPLAMVEREVTLKMRVPTPEQIARSKEILAITGEGEKKLPKLAKNYAERILALAEQGETMPIKLQALRIGDLVIGSVPFETFAEIGLDLKQRSPFADTFIIELANGAGGYLPTPRQHEFGGYETWLSTNKVQKDSSVIITEQLLEMFAELKQGTS
ncbi:MAG: neutral/alkaline non-lysosomal ceramidase N-terminal domain-containing protein, partial [Verrucomicrobiae bacterium]|nr:neutral/alkaline non-lysosomal ceramidase N-terminal domain-containing protein [Verrucomicrobiae bacterium]